MQSMVFTKKIASLLEKELKKVNSEFSISFKASNSHVASKSSYIEIIYPENYDGDISSIKISDYFEKGLCDYNIDTTGYELNNNEANEFCNRILNKIHLKLF